MGWRSAPSERAVSSRANWEPRTRRRPPSREARTSTCRLAPCREAASSVVRTTLRLMEKLPRWVDRQRASSVIYHGNEARDKGRHDKLKLPMCHVKCAKLRTTSTDIHRRSGRAHGFSRLAQCRASTAIPCALPEVGWVDPAAGATRAVSGA